MRIFINATNIHQGGGGVLLASLVSALNNEYKDSVLVFDERMSIASFPDNAMIKKVRPTIFSRLISDLWLKKTVRNDDVVICFGNLPPIFRLNCKVVVFLQNRYLVDNSISLASLSWSLRFKILLERLWLIRKIKNVNLTIVQTKTMESLVNSFFPVGVDCKVFPFIANVLSDNIINELKHDKHFDFIYVASGEYHKNHLNLIEAWKKLAKQNVYPSLCVTLDQNLFPLLCDLIQQAVSDYQLKIVNVGRVSHSSTLELLAQSRALIYPSLFESFGMPLIEARQLNLPIISSELDYVRDVVTPSQTFDPNSSLSISRAVKRHLELSDDTKVFNSPDQFLNMVMDYVAELNN